MPVVLGVLDSPDAPFPALVERWRRIEAHGYDQLWLADHSGDYRNLGGPWFDCWTALAVAATATSRLRIGSLVSNPVLRPPALLAKEALAVDHLSEGRLELGIGTGVAGFDHEAAGLPYWEPKERAERFAEYVELVDHILRAPHRASPRAGRYHRTEGMSTAPGAVQAPRPPITVGGQSPTVLRVAARCGDRWNTHGPFGADVDGILERTAEQSARLDQLCEEAGRGPADVSRSLLLFDALDPWRRTDPSDALDALADTVERFRGIGIDEFVLLHPGDDRQELLERAAAMLHRSFNDDRGGNAGGEANRKGVDHGQGNT